MKPLRHTCAALLLVAPLFAQTKATEVRLHIPAGTWSVRDLLTHAEQALRTPIVADPTELAQGSDAPVRLQAGLGLDPEHGRDALAALLSTRGLLLTKNEAGQTEVKAVPRGLPDWVRERAVPTTMADLLDHPFRDSLVRVELQTKVQALILQNMLNVAKAHGDAVPSVEALANGIACTGTASAVRLAVTQLAAFDPQLARALRPAPPVSILGAQPGRTVELTAGEHTIPDLVDLLATTAGINVVMSPAVAALSETVTIDKAQSLSSQSGADTLTTRLWQQRVLLLELDVRHALYEVVLVEAGRRAPPIERASRRTVDEALAASECVRFVTVPYSAQHLAPEQVMALLRETMSNVRPGDDGCLTVLGTPDGILLTGLSPQIAALLRELQAKDQANRG